MKIALINGSPKTKNSASRILLEDLKKYLEKNAEVANFEIHLSEITKEVIEELKKIDTWVFACPLYVDGIPGHLLSCLIQLEEVSIHKSDLHIYGIVNCGFYEGIHGKLALQILENWCLKAGFIWGGGIGVGCGGALVGMPKTAAGHGPKAAIDKAVAKLSDIIIKGEIQKNNYVSLAFPRFLYKIVGQMRWRKLIKANGGKAKDLGKKYIE
jgi:hypothetical protein